MFSKFLTITNHNYIFLVTKFFSILYIFSSGNTVEKYLVIAKLETRGYPEAPCTSRLKIPHSHTTKLHKNPLAK